MANVEIDHLYRQVEALKGECLRLRQRLASDVHKRVSDLEREKLILEARIAHLEKLPVFVEASEKGPCFVCGKEAPCVGLRVRLLNAFLDRLVCSSACAADGVHRLGTNVEAFLSLESLKSSSFFARPGS